VALGGGGYDLRNVARAWTAAWAVMNDVELPAALPASFDRDVEIYEFEPRSLWDDPARISEATRERVKDYVDRQVAAVRRLVFPLHGL